MSYSIVVDLVPPRSGVDPGKPRPIRLRVSYDAERVDLRLGCSVESEKWSRDAERPLPGIRSKNGVTSAYINKRLDSAMTEIAQMFARYELEERRPTPLELSSEYATRFLKKGKERSPVKKGNIFYISYDRFIREQSVIGSWSASHRRRHITVKNHFKDLAPSLRFPDITKDFMISFLNSLFAKDLRNTTINKILSYARTFLAWAEEEGLYSGVQHLKFKPKLKGSDGSLKPVVYLTWEELMRLYNLGIPPTKKYLSRVRDVFCFCCFTGLRHSDAFNLSKVDIQRERIQVISQKTIDPLYIELNEYSTKLLEKYENMPGAKALPVISNQKMNQYLEELGQLAGLNESVKTVFYIGSERHEVVLPLWKMLTTHCGRRTFIVLALTLGIPVVVIMKWTGHKSLSSMKPYIAIVDDLKEEEMKKISGAGETLSNGGTQKSTQK